MKVSLRRTQNQPMSPARRRQRDPRRDADQALIANIVPSTATDRRPIRKMQRGRATSGR